VRSIPIPIELVVSLDIAKNVILLNMTMLSKMITLKYFQQSCNQGEADKLNVHIVPHTHDDVGWLKTVDQYYYGANSSIAWAGVQYILDTVVQQLSVDPTRRFIYVEVAFFSRWWREQNTEVQQEVKRLVQEGRLEFILGGWSMNDEAATHYNAIIDQMTLGLRFLNDTFGPCARPRVAWQIDPFGHSREQASLFAQMGFDGLFFGRLDYQDKETREMKLKMEEIWRGSQSLHHPEADLFTGLNENGYNPPAGFCFDAYCKDDPIMDDPTLEDNNVKQKVDDFISAAHKQAKHFRTNHIMMTMGSDFQYSNAKAWFKNLDKLMKYVNSAVRYKNCFFLWSVKSDDFFPYADAPHQFWTGYFTSRPGLKGYVRESNKYLQVCNQLETVAHLRSGMKSNLRTSKSNVLRAAMGVAQHHDAVSGTSKQHVANDYAKRLYIDKLKSGGRHCKDVISSVITEGSSNLTFCDYMNITLCDFTQNSNRFTAVVYNPLARAVSKYIRIPVDCTPSYIFVVIELLVPVSEATESVRRNRGNANCELVFLAKLPALGYNSFSVIPPISCIFVDLIEKYKSSATNKRLFTPKGKVVNPSDDITISNEVCFCMNSIVIVVITNKTSQSYITHFLLVGFCDDYLHDNFFLLYFTNKPTLSTVLQYNFYVYNVIDIIVKLIVYLQGSNPLVQEVYQKFSDWAYQVVRLYKGIKHIEVEWTVGPIPVKDQWGKEVISRYETNIDSNGYFYTDANGREVLERKKNYRPTWKLNQTEPVAGNYYPVNSRIYIRDAHVQLTVLTDRSQGGSSLSSGALELMVHRRLLGEDSKGVAEPLNETGQFGDGLITRGKHWLLLDTVTSSAKQHRLLGEEAFMSPLVMFGGATPPALVQVGFQSFIVNPLPPNIHLLTLATTNSGELLVRLEHQFAKHDDDVLS
uniref:Alpha-mannosidase n=1 Tax=Ciona savignyi TaxID=51511 RepID=H2Z3Z0_CIOSA